MSRRSYYRGACATSSHRTYDMFSFESDIAVHAQSPPFVALLADCVRSQSLINNITDTMAAP